MLRGVERASLAVARGSKSLRRRAVRVDWSSGESGGRGQGEEGLEEEDIWD